MTTHDIIPYTLGAKVRFRPHHPGHIWDARPHWVHNIHVLYTWGSPRNPVVLYTVSDSDDPDAQGKRLTPMTSVTQLRHWEEQA